MAQRGSNTNNDNLNNRPMPGRAQVGRSNQVDDEGEDEGSSGHHHANAAFHHETAAHHHREAAEHTEVGNHDEAERHHNMALDHGERAQQHSDNADRQRQGTPTRSNAGERGNSGARVSQSQNRQGNRSTGRSIEQDNDLDLAGDDGDENVRGPRSNDEPARGSRTNGSRNRPQA